MIVGERFAWAHLPKTGGTATTEMFRLFPELVVDGDFDESNDKHALFRDRPDQVDGKELAMNIRRLPFWVLSRAQHVARWGIYPDYKPIPMESPRALSESSFPDSRLALYVDGGRFPITAWLRMESLAADFLSFVSEFTEVTEEQRHKAQNLSSVNGLEYDHEVDHWFTADQVRTMYERNPTWAAIERQMYGDLYRSG